MLPGHVSKLLMVSTIILFCFAVAWVFWNADGSYEERTGPHASVTSRSGRKQAAAAASKLMADADKMDALEKKNAPGFAKKLAPKLAATKAAVAKIATEKQRTQRHTCLHNNTSLEYYRCRRKALLEGCSEICDSSIKGHSSLFFDAVQKHVDCAGLWANEEIDASLGDGQWPPPAYPPGIFIKDFRQNGAVIVKKTGHYKQRYAGGDASNSKWTEKAVEALVQQARAQKLRGSYGVDSTNEILAALARMNITGQRVLVIGSEQPWVEACALASGAREVWTLEYGKISSTHPQIKTITPFEARRLYLAGKLPMFDAVLTYSSVEHSGLGRYGDALNPWGDVQAVARAWCVTKPGGKMLLGVMECGSADTIEYNLHRCYHTHSYTHLTANWKQEFRGKTFLNALLVLSKLPAAPAPRAQA
jgi:hypothetical protein